MSFPRSIVLSALLVIVPLGAWPARAQSFTGSYAVEVAPGTYVVRDSEEERGYPYVSCGYYCTAPVQHRRAARASRRQHRAVEASARKHDESTIHTTKIVRDSPVVIEHRRVVDDPPRIVERHRYVEDVPPAPKYVRDENGGARKMPRVIRAEAEVTILGPDRMSIRLFRKSGAEARAETRR